MRYDNVQHSLCVLCVYALCSAPGLSSASRRAKPYRHELHALPSGQTRVAYGTEITGPNASAFGPLVTGDFGDVLKALKRLAEAPDAPD